MLGVYGMLECCKLCYELLLLLNMADISCLLCKRLWSDHAVLSALFV